MKNLIQLISVNMVLAPYARVCVCVCVRVVLGGHNKRGQNQRGPCSARLTHQASHPTLGIVFSLIRLGLT